MASKNELNPLEGTGCVRKGGISGGVKQLWNGQDALGNGLSSH